MEPDPSAPSHYPYGIRIDDSIHELTSSLLCSFKWIIKDFKSLLQHSVLRIVSPPFVIGGVTWRIILKRYDEVVYLTASLSKFQHRSPPRSITFKIVLKINEDEICGRSRETVVDGKCCDDTVLSKEELGILMIISKEELRKRMTTDDLKVIFFAYPEVEEQTSEEVILKADMSSNKMNEGFGILSSHMKELYTQGQNWDFTIKVRNKDFYVHKAILSARSPLLAAMVRFDMVEMNSGVIKIDCEPDVFKHFLLYLYSGQAEGLSWDNATHLYKLGNKYALPHLRKECLQFMEGNLCVGTFCEAIALAATYNEPTLVKLAEEFFLRNAKSIVVTNEWQVLMKDNPVACNELFLKHITSPSKVP